MKPHESHKLNKLAVEEVLSKQKTLARLYQMSNTGSVHEAIETEKMQKIMSAHMSRDLHCPFWMRKRQ